MLAGGRVKISDAYSFTIYHLPYPFTISKYKCLKDFFHDLFLHKHFKITILIPFLPVQLNAK